MGQGLPHVVRKRRSHLESQAHQETRPACRHRLGVVGRAAADGPSVRFLSWARTSALGFSDAERASVSHGLASPLTAVNAKKKKLINWLNSLN